MVIKSAPFEMDGQKIAFTNSKNNPIRPWFYRMHVQLMEKAYNEGMDQGKIKIEMEMHPDLWFCIAQLYSYGHYYDDSDPVKNVYFTEYSNEAACRHEEYLARQALPTNGIWCPAILNHKIANSEILFLVDGDLLGKMINIHCHIEKE